MTPELLEAMKIFRELSVLTHRELFLEDDSLDRYNDACETITREFVRMADAGELVQVKTCYECLDDRCECGGSGRIYEPLIAKGDA